MGRTVLQSLGSFLARERASTEFRQSPGGRGPGPRLPILAGVLCGPGLLLHLSESRFLIHRMGCVDGSAPTFKNKLVSEVRSPEGSFWLGRGPVTPPQNDLKTSPVQ